MLDDPRTAIAEAYVADDGTLMTNCETCGYAIALHPKPFRQQANIGPGPSWLFIPDNVWVDDATGGLCPTPPWDADVAHIPVAVERIAFISCGKTKLDHAAPARDLYTGNLFTAARNYVDGNPAFDRWFILSALHGVVHPDTVLEPYDARIPGRVSEARYWGTRALTSPLLPAERTMTEITSFAGNDYNGPLYEAIRQIKPWHLHEPLAGLQVGERLRWFAERRAA